MTCNALCAILAQPVSSMGAWRPLKTDSAQHLCSASVVNVYCHCFSGVLAGPASRCCWSAAWFLPDSRSLCGWLRRSRGVSQWIAGTGCRALVESCSWPVFSPSFFPSVCLVSSCLPLLLSFLLVCHDFFRSVLGNAVAYRSRATNRCRRLSLDTDTDLRGCHGMFFFFLQVGRRWVFR